MKVTPRGRDYLQATILLGLVALILDADVLLALALTLAIVALIAYLIVESISKFNTTVTFEPVVQSVFKGEEARVKVRVQLKRAPWMSAGVESLEPPPGVESHFTVVDENTIRVALKTKYSGRFEGFIVRLQVIDIMGLFSKEIATVYGDFCLDSLPNSLLAPKPVARPMPLALGERSARSPGSSLELYALDQYQPFSETKNVLWKRVARMPDERLIVRIREASIPKSIHIGFIELADRFDDLNELDPSERVEAKEEAELTWKDLTCEGLGALGNQILSVACEIEIMHLVNARTQNEIEFAKAENLSDLARAIMGIWSEPIKDQNFEKSIELIAMSDLIVCGLRDLSNSSIAEAVARKPSLIISEDWSDPAFLGKESLIFTGTEDVKRLVQVLVER